MTTWDPREDELRQDDLGRALQALPLSRAPHTLAPRVMAAIAAGVASARRDYTWFDWPVWAQTTSALLLVVLAAGLAMVWPDVSARVSLLMDGDVVRLAERLLLAWQPIVLTMTAVFTAAALMCATLGALLGRVALGGGTSR